MDLPNGRVWLTFSNTGSQGTVFHVYDELHLTRYPRRYTVEAGKSLSDSWEAQSDDQGRYSLWVLGPNGCHQLDGSHRWYDFTVTLGGAFERRFVGRLETGEDGVSDPAMGQG